MQPVPSAEKHATGAKHRRNKSFNFLRLEAILLKFYRNLELVILKNVSFRFLAFLSENDVTKLATIFFFKNGLFNDGF